MPEPQPIRKHAAGVSLAFLVAALIAGHAMATMAVLVLPAVAPAVARDYGFDPSLIGYQISLVAMGMAVSLSLLGNLSRRLGACRSNQLGHGMVATGMLILLIPRAPFLVVGSLVAGVGYGLITPSASALLVRFTPLTRRSFVFSLHQVGIPLGGIFAALISPVVAVMAGWRWSVLLSALLLYGVIALMQFRRRSWDDDRDPASPAVTRNPFAGIAAIWRRRSLRLLTVAGSCYSWTQFCAATFAVVACVETLGMSLVAAGTVLTVVQVSSAAGRVLLGWIVDRVGDVRLALAWTAAVMMLVSGALLAMSPAYPLPLIYFLFAVLGGASGSWSGAVLAEVGRLAPQGRVSLAISGTLMITNFGKFLGPIILANVYAVTNSYGWAYASLVVPSAVALGCLVASRAAPRA